MPLRDENGKPLSGAAQRKKKIQNRKEQMAREEERKHSPKPKGLSFDDLPTPNLESSDEAVTWWNKVLLVSADQIMRDPVMPLEQKIKFLFDGAGKAGLLRDKAKEQETIKKVFKNQNKEKNSLGLQDANQFVAPQTIPRPAR
jgi:hypothetical protein